MLDLVERFESDGICVTRHPDVLWTDLGGATVILNPQTGQYYELRGVGSAIWDFLESPQHLTAIARHVHGRFRVEQRICLQDARRFVGDLLRASLLAADSDRHPGTQLKPD